MILFKKTFRGAIMLLNKKEELIELSAEDVKNNIDSGVWVYCNPKYYARRKRTRQNVNERKKSLLFTNPNGQIYVKVLEPLHLEKIEENKYEIIGGNHRTQAICELLDEHPEYYFHPIRAIIKPPSSIADKIQLQIDLEESIGRIKPYHKATLLAEIESALDQELRDIFQKEYEELVSIVDPDIETKEKIERLSKWLKPGSRGFAKQFNEYINQKLRLTDNPNSLSVILAKFRTFNQNKTEKLENWVCNEHMSLEAAIAIINNSNGESEKIDAFLDELERNYLSSSKDNDDEVEFYLSFGQVKSYLNNIKTEEKPANSDVQQIEQSQPKKDKVKLSKEEFIDQVSFKLDNIIEYKINENDNQLDLVNFVTTSLSSTAKVIKAIPNITSDQSKDLFFKAQDIVSILKGINLDELPKDSYQTIHYAISVIDEALSKIESGKKSKKTITASATLENLTLSEVNDDEVNEIN